MSELISLGWFIVGIFWAIAGKSIIEVAACFLVAMLVLTCNAVMDIMKNEMHEGDDIFDVIENFECEYTSLFIFWTIFIALVFIISLIAWIVSKNGG